MNLGTLTRAGLPVPPGISVTTDAYRQVAASAGPMLEPVFDALASTSSTDTARLARLAAEARAAVLAAPVPDNVVQAIAEGYARLGADVPVAVRSSATAEDLPFASFAGQQDTYLNVVGRDHVIDATRRCWASLWTDRAVAYRATNGIDPRTVRLAVVIQRMIDAATAGVLFTANPVTGRRRQAVIDASLGLGEAVVSGAVNPDHFVVDTASGEILERRLGDKRLVIRATPGGGTAHVEAPLDAHAACITDDQVRALVALGDRVERLFGSPQDTEWAIDADGAIWLTQARPITTLFPLPASAPPPGEGLSVYFCFSLAQGLNRPITPMGLAAFRLLGSAVSELLGFPVTHPREGPARYADAGGRVFVDITGVLRSAVGRAFFPRVLDIMEARSAVILRGLFDDPRLALTVRSRLPAARRALRVMARFAVPVTAARAILRPDAARERAAEVGRDLASRLTVPAAATALDRLNFVERILLRECVPIVPRVMPSAAVGLLSLPLARKLLGTDATEDELQAVTRGLPHNVTTQMNLALWTLACRIRDDADSAAAFRNATLDELAERLKSGTLPPVAQTGLAEFLSQWGHRAVAEIDVGMPRWSDDPRHVLGVLVSYLKIEPGPAAPDAAFARGAAEADAMIDTLASRARRRGRLRGALVRIALRRVRALAGLRELPKVLSRPGARRGAPRADVGGIRPRRSGPSGGGRRHLLHRSRRGPRRPRRPGPSGDRHQAAGDVRAGAPPPARATRAAVGWDRAGSHGQASRGARPDRIARGHARVGRTDHGHRARDSRSCRRAARAGRNPRRTVHGSRVDAALSRRCRPRDGDGRSQLARRRRRPRVRDSGRRRRAERDRSHLDGAADHR